MRSVSQVLMSDIGSLGGNEGLRHPPKGGTV